MKIERRDSFGWADTTAARADCDMGLVIHYDGASKPRGVAGWTHAQCREYWQWCRRFHIKTNGWRDIGYSYGVCPHGAVLEGRGWRREQAAQPGGNTSWTSVTLMLGDGEDPTPAQVEGVRELRAYLRGQGLGVHVRGHRDFVSTSCPGDRLYARLAEFAKPPTPTKEDDDMPSPKEIYDAVWERDAMPAPDGNEKTNPTWKPSSVLTDVNKKVRALTSQVDNLERTLAEVLALLKAQD